MEEKSNPIFFIDGFVHSAKKRLTNKTLKFSSRIQFKNISFQFEEKMIHQIYKTIQTDVIRGNGKVKIEYLHMVGLKKFDKSCWEHIFTSNVHIKLNCIHDINPFILLDVTLRRQVFPLLSSHTCLLC